MPQSGITDRWRGQFNCACLNLQPIKLTLLFNSAGAQLSHTDCTLGYKKRGWHHYTASFWLVAAEAAPYLQGKFAQPA